VESDECDAMNDFLAAAPDAQVTHGGGTYAHLMPADHERARAAIESAFARQAEGLTEDHGSRRPARDS